MNLKTKLITISILCFISIIIVLIIFVNKDTNGSVDSTISTNTSNSLDKLTTTQESLADEYEASAPESTLDEELYNLFTCNTDDDEPIAFATVSSNILDKSYESGKVYYYGFRQYWKDSDFTEESTEEEYLKKGMCNTIHTSKEADEFLSYFFSDDEAIETIDFGNAICYTSVKDQEKKFVFFEYYNYEGDDRIYASGCRYNVEDVEFIATYDTNKTGNDLFHSLAGDTQINSSNFNEMITLKDEYIKEFSALNHGITSIDYLGEPYNDGQCYHVSGRVYFDNHDKELYRYYYVTDGDHSSYYIYDSNGMLVQFFDIGGMAYKGLEENNDIAIGYPFETYIFAR